MTPVVGTITAIQIFITISSHHNDEESLTANFKGTTKFSFALTMGKVNKAACQIQQPALQLPTTSGMGQIWTSTSTSPTMRKDLISIGCATVLLKRGREVFIGSWENA
jgi:hypothetical protein